MNWKVNLAAITGMLVSLSAGADTLNASFDCSKASTRVEHLICSTPELAADDVKLDQLYREKLSASDDKAELKSEQQKWLAERDACADADCIGQLYDSRMDALHGAVPIIGAVPLQGAPSTIQPEASSNTAEQSAQTDQPTTNPSASQAPVSDSSNASASDNHAGPNVQASNSSPPEPTVAEPAAQSESPFPENVMGLAMPLIVVLSAIFVFFDAKRIGVRKGLITGFGDMGPWAWFFVTLFIWIVGFPSYLYYRGKFKAAISAMEGKEHPAQQAVPTGNRFCIKCGKQMSDKAQFCSECGNPANPIGQQRSPSATTTQAEPPKISKGRTLSEGEVLLLAEARKKSGWIAALLNIFLPGAGYIYCGRWVRAIIAFSLAFAIYIVSVGTGIIGILTL